MKTALALLVLVLLGFAAAGCGSGKKKTSTGSITVTGTTTISSVATGTRISCKGTTGGAGVPPPGQGVAGFQDGPAMSSEIRVTHRKNGSAVVICRHS